MSHSVQIQRVLKHNRTPTGLVLEHLNDSRWPVIAGHCLRIDEGIEHLVHVVYTKGHLKVPIHWHGRQTEPLTCRLSVIQFEFEAILVE
jgi:hypothetical protein